MREDEYTEFKSQYTDDIKRTAIAFLNTDGGTLYVGIDDDGTVLGVKDSDDTMKRLSQNLRQSIRPDCTRFIRIAPVEMDQKTVVQTSVTSGTHKPYYVGEKGMRPAGVFVRVGSTSVQADEEQIRQMIKTADKESYEEQRASRQDLTFTGIQRYFDEQEIAFTESKLRTLGFVSSDGFFTNLAMLFSDQNEHSIKCAIFEGTTKTRFKDRKEFTGPLFQQIEDVLSYLKVYNRVSSEITMKERIDRWDYPEQAIREAVLNAVVHRDYAYDGSILINLFDDRLEVMSLGGLVKGLNEELITEGVSECRNKKLAAIFYRFCYIEAYGTGIPRIFEAYADCQRKPAIAVFNGAFRMTLPNQKYGDTESPVRAVDMCGQGTRYDIQEETASFACDSGNMHVYLIEQFLQKNQYATKETAAPVFGVKTNRAYGILEELTAQGFLKSAKLGRSKVYYLNRQ